MDVFQPPAKARHPSGRGQPPLLHTCEGVRLGQKVDIHRMYGDRHLRSDETSWSGNFPFETARRPFDDLDDVQHFHGFHRSSGDRLVVPSAEA